MSHESRPFFTPKRHVRCLVDGEGVFPPESRRCWFSLGWILEYFVLYSYTLRLTRQLLKSRFLMGKLAKWPFNSYSVHNQRVNEHLFTTFNGNNRYTLTINQLSIISVAIMFPQPTTGILVGSRLCEHTSQLDQLHLVRPETISAGVTGHSC